MFPYFIYYIMDFLIETHAQQAEEREERRRRQREANNRHREKIQRLREELRYIYILYPPNETMRDAEKSILCFRLLKDYLQTKNEKDKKLIFKYSLINDYHYNQMKTLNIFNERLLGYTSNNWEELIENYEHTMRRDHGEDWRQIEDIRISFHYEELKKVLNVYTHYNLNNRRDMSGRPPNEQETRNRSKLLDYIN
jgi:hypothetical protein